MLLSQTDLMRVKVSESLHTIRSTSTVRKAVKRFKDCTLSFMYWCGYSFMQSKDFPKDLQWWTTFTASDDRRVTEQPDHVISNGRPALCRIKEHVTAVSIECEFNSFFRCKYGKVTPTVFLPVRNGVQETTDLLRRINLQKCSCVMISCGEQVERDLLSHDGVNSDKNEPTSSSTGLDKRSQRFCRWFVRPSYD